MDHDCRPHSPAPIFGHLFDWWEGAVGEGWLQEATTPWGTEASPSLCPPALREGVQYPGPSCSQEWGGACTPEGVSACCLLKEA